MLIITLSPYVHTFLQTRIDTFGPSGSSEIPLECTNGVSHLKYFPFVGLLQEFYHIYLIVSLL